MNYDLIVLGSGPGGYVAAIRASQLGLKTAIVEKESLGGVCLNWGCIPTKALLKSASVYNDIKHSDDYGITVDSSTVNFEQIIKRSRDVAEGMSKGVQYLMKKNKIDVIFGFGEITQSNNVEVTNENKEKTTFTAKHIIIATGARSAEIPSIIKDGKKVIGYREAMSLHKLPKSMIVVGSGAIGTEFAYFYHSLGTEVTLVEYMPAILPLEDEEVSKQLARTFKKTGMKVMVDTKVESVDSAGENCKVIVQNKKGEETLEAEIVLSAVGVKANIEGIGLEQVGIITDNGKIVVDEYYQTNIKGIYAIGDCVPGPALAHVASAEGIICVENIAGKVPLPLNYNNIPYCTYCMPEVASVGYTEKAAIEAGYEVKIGKFPFSASGKASAVGHKDGFVKLIFDTKYDELLGAHMVGYNVTEMIAEVVMARKLETTAYEIIKAVHPHPSMSEAVMEATAAAYGEAIHL